MEIINLEFYYYLVNYLTVFVASVVDPNTFNSDPDPDPDPAKKNEFGSGSGSGSRILNPDPDPDPQGIFWNKFQNMR